MTQIDSLLHQIQIINTKNQEILDATGARFNMFKLCGVNHYENTHSSILAEFLNPKGSHGLNIKLLKAFVDLFASDDIKNSFNFEKAQVITEYSTNYGRIDIVIKDNLQNILILENKIYAVDQFEQLKRYHSYAQKYKKHEIFYLTLTGSEASEHSGQNIVYTRLSYAVQIIQWLEQCVHIAVNHPIVRETINQYINHLKTLTNQDMDIKNQDEILKNIVDNPNYIKSAQQIHQIWDACKKEIINRLKPNLQEIAQKLNLELYIGDNLGLNSTGFWFKKTEWDFSILFWFDQNYERISVGIDDWKLPNGIKLTEEKKNKLSQFLKDFTIHKSINHNWVWGTVFEAWGECPWEDVQKEIPFEIEEITSKILNKLSTLNN